ncbi:MAG: hypothetical protein V1836_04365 [Candidatus Aenigmatarchaeota archaeon]
MATEGLRYEGADRVYTTKNVVGNRGIVKPSRRQLEYTDTLAKDYMFREAVEEQFIGFLLSTNQLSLAPSTFDTPEIISELRKAAGSYRTDKPPYKIKLGSETVAEIAKASYLLHDFIDAEGIAVPRYMGGPSKKAIPLVVATAMEIAKYDKTDRYFVFNDKQDEGKFSIENKLKEIGVTIRGKAEMSDQLSVHGTKTFAAKCAKNIRDSNEYFDAIVGEDIDGLVGAVAILKTLYDDNHTNGSKTKKLAYERARTVIEGGMRRVVYDIKGVERGDKVFLVAKNRHRPEGELFGYAHDADVILPIDDSAVSYRSMRKYLETLRHENPNVIVNDIIELVSIEELDCTKKGFEDYLKETWKIEDPKSALHILTTSKRIFNYLHKKEMTRGQEPLIDKAKLRSANEYFKEIEELAKKCPDVLFRY